MKDLWNNSKKEKINKNKVIISIIIVVITILLIAIAIVYRANPEIREWIDKNIFRKEVLQDKVTVIELKEEQDKNIYAFNKYIGILNKNIFTIYNNNGNKEEELDILVSNPIFSSSNRFLTIAESKGQKLYTISDKEVIWENSVEGSISQVYVNKNGYVAVVISDTIHKTVIAVYNPQGKELFKTYLSSTRTVDVSISNDNKHLAVAEIDTSGTIIQSNIKIISIDKASSDPTNSVENIYQSESGKLITNIEYQDKEKLICMYTDSIYIIENGKEDILFDNKERKIIFQSVELSNSIVSVEEKSSGLFTANSLITLTNTDNKSQKEYKTDDVTKELYTYGDVISLNLGTEVEFINKDGWLIKRYIANQEITNIVVSNTLAGIIYRDKIEIINL